jgi:hypothetical protein
LVSFWLEGFIGIAFEGETRSEDEGIRKKGVASKVSMMT